MSRRFPDSKAAREIPEVWLWSQREGQPSRSQRQHGPLPPSPTRFLASLSPSCAPTTFPSGRSFRMGRSVSRNRARTWGHLLLPLHWGSPRRSTGRAVFGNLQPRRSTFRKGWSFLDRGVDRMKCPLPAATSRSQGKPGRSSSELTLLAPDGRFRVEPEATGVRPPIDATHPERENDSPYPAAGRRKRDSNG